MSQSAAQTLPQAPVQAPHNAPESAVQPAPVAVPSGDGWQSFHWAWERLSRIHADCCAVIAAAGGDADLDIEDAHEAVRRALALSGSALPLPVATLPKPKKKAKKSRRS